MQKEPERNKRAVIYLRIVNGKELDPLNSLVAQERVCRRYAAARGYEIDKVIKETGGGQRTLERPGVMQLLAYCLEEANHIDTVIVASLDRLTRNHPDYKWLRVMLEQGKVEIEVAREHSTPVDEFVDRMTALLAQYAGDRCPRCNGAEDYSPQDDI